MSRLGVVFVIAALAIGCLAIGAAGCSSVRGTAPVSIDQGSPDSVAKAYQQAYEERNFAAMMACIKPSQQGRVDPGLVVAKEFSDQVMTVSDLTRDRFGDELADELVRMCGRVLRSPFDVTEEDGLNWDRITFDVRGDTARLLLDRRPHHGVPRFERVRGKWFIAQNYEETPSTPMIGAGLLRAYYRQGMEELKTLEDHLRHHRVNEEDLWELLLVNEGEPRGGAVVQGMQIKVSTIRGPVFRQRTVPANPLIFSVTASYARSQVSPICWYMPSMGLGEGIVVKIDGEEIAQPPHA
ncbi:MAG: hypothetical protein KAU28_02375, partial [Phycisphaerae bacterium]|nr:hypothetical protein [Phycisphaerae bacterium]